MFRVVYVFGCLLRVLWFVLFALFGLCVLRGLFDLAGMFDVLYE